MKEGPDIAKLANLLGDPARANMLSALMSSMALTAGELAKEAGVMPQTATFHLGRLKEAGLVKNEAQGRHRYYRIASYEVAELLEGLMGLASITRQLRTRPGPREPELRYARVCYDHLAGSAGVRLFDSLITRQLIQYEPEGLNISSKGRSFFFAQGLDIQTIEHENRPVCRTCLDWSERRYHLSGSLGAALYSMFIARKWIGRQVNSRAVTFSKTGQHGFEDFISFSVKADE